MLSITLVGKEQVVARLDRMPGKIHDAVFKEITELCLMIENYVKTQKLSGQVLNKISGRLQSSIHGDELPRDSGGTITGRIFSAAPMPYAAIHEFGFHGTETVREHIRTTVFGKKVSPFTVPSFTRTMNMPERSFLRSSLTDNAPKIIQGLKDAIKEATK